MGLAFHQKAWNQLRRVRPSLAMLVMFVVLLGLINCLVVNQRIVLELFFIPVILGAWFLPKRDAVGVALLAALMVIAYAFFIPNKLNNGYHPALFWTDLGIWGGILVVTAYVVSTLRAWTEEAMASLQRAYSGVLSILSKFIETVDVDTEAHSVRVSALAVRIAEALQLPRPTIEEARITGLLHDVGKVEVSVEILRKAASLSEADQSAIRQHATRGAALVKPVGGMLSSIADAVENHHEKFDGSGYRGLKGQEIPIVSRIVAVADAFDALVSDRPYRRGVSIFEAMETLQAASGSHFDPDVVVALEKVADSEGERAVLSLYETLP